MIILFLILNYLIKKKDVIEVPVASPNIIGATILVSETWLPVAGKSTNLHKVIEDTICNIRASATNTMHTIINVFDVFAYLDESNNTKHPITTKIANPIQLTNVDVNEK